MIAEVRKLYRIDDRRIYAMGHSMGGYGRGVSRKTIRTFSPRWLRLQVAAIPPEWKKSSPSRKSLFTVITTRPFWSRNRGQWSKPPESWGLKCNTSKFMGEITGMWSFPTFHRSSSSLLRTRRKP